ncbi:MAG: hypothetical protein K6C05_09000 [Anaerovibrio sp.]|uniref:hypothetical protein n=1 Tax=Anaerovibrio sp. TaxID=1872532 RepID=UPI0025EBDCD5|nr:hypothetical protein [Anaerovibrio sp.]MCR5176969.1 hypothetical protein [Anaerovibrio sp.]
MRHFITLAVLVLVAGFFTTAFANTAFKETENLDRMYDCIGGTWIDQNGHRPVEITNSALNGVRIADAENFVGDAATGSATLTLADLSGTKFMNVYWATVSGRKTIRLNDSLVLAPMRAAASHTETVGGLYLDMKMTDLLAKYGAARNLTPAETQERCGLLVGSWYYQDIGLIVTFDPCTYTIDRLIVLEDSDTAFDRSMLNASSDLDKYVGIYGWKNKLKSGDVVSMGSGESMSFKYYPAAVILQLSTLD